MLAGHLREQNGMFQMVLSYKDVDGKRKTKSISTGLPVRGNKKRAEAMLTVARKKYESVEQITNSELLFSDFMLEWLEIIKNSVELTTYSAYAITIKSQIVPYFKGKGIKLVDLKPKDIQDYYQYGLNVEKISANTVIHRHANIRKALQYAFKTGLISYNPADRVERPRKVRFTTTIYNDKELDTLFSVVKGTPIELAVILGAFYGLRRSEVVGLRWDAIDFERKTITIRHTVTEVQLNGKEVVVDKDRTKTKSSYRTLPLVAPFAKLLQRIKAEQEQNEKFVAGPIAWITWTISMSMNWGKGSSRDSSHRISESP